MESRMYSIRAKMPIYMYIQLLIVKNIETSWVILNWVSLNNIFDGLLLLDANYIHDQNQAIWLDTLVPAVSRSKSGPRNSRQKCQTTLSQ